MKHFTLLATVLLLLPSAALAAPANLDEILDTVLVHVDAAFTTAQNGVEGSNLNEEDKNQISNVLKTRHDTVKNSINNIR